jgi:hypothetical protein
MICEYCHEDFSTSEGYKAHHESCYFKENPKPKPEPKEESSNEEEQIEKVNDVIQEIDKNNFEDMGYPDLKKLAKEKGIKGSHKMKKDKLIKALKDIER